MNTEAAAARRTSSSVLVAIAWKRYIAAVQQCEDDAYDLIEQLAWSQLLEALARIQSIDRYRQRAELRRGH